MDSEFNVVYYKCSKCDHSIVAHKGLPMRQKISEHNLEHQRTDNLENFWKEFNEQ